MSRNQTVVSLDPIDRTRKAQDSPISRLFKTRHFGGKQAKKTYPFGHYLFVGKQRSGKTASAVWYMERLTKQFKKKGKKVKGYSNIGLGIPVICNQLPELFNKIEYDPDTVHIFLIDEIQSYYPKDTKNRQKLDEIDKLTGELSQLGKRQIILLSTAQVYGRVNKSIREQCLFMVNCRFSRLSRRFVNDFIEGDDVLCDDLGRWSGIPQKILVHGLSKWEYDTHKMITE